MSFFHAGVKWQKSYFFATMAIRGIMITKVEKRIKIRVTGEVEGAFSRSGTQAKAFEYGLVGLAKNSPNSTLKIEVQGKIGRIAKFIE